MMMSRTHLYDTRSNGLTAQVPDGRRGNWNGAAGRDQGVVRTPGHGIPGVIDGEAGTGSPTTAPEGAASREERTTRLVAKRTLLASPQRVPGQEGVQEPRRALTPGDGVRRTPASPGLHQDGRGQRPTGLFSRSGVAKTSANDDHHTSIERHAPRPEDIDIFGDADRGRPSQIDQRTPHGRFRSPMTIPTNPARAPGTATGTRAQTPPMTRTTTASDQPPTAQPLTATLLLLAPPQALPPLAPPPTATDEVELDSSIVESIGDADDPVIEVTVLQLRLALLKQRAAHPCFFTTAEPLVKPRPPPIKTVAATWTLALVAGIPWSSAPPSVNKSLLVTVAADQPETQTPQPPTAQLTPALPLTPLHIKMAHVQNTPPRLSYNRKNFIKDLVQNTLLGIMQLFFQTLDLYDEIFTFLA